MAQVTEKLTIAEAADLIECEGLGYAVQSHTSYTSIADTKLRSMWKRCAKLLDEIEAYVEEHAGEDDVSFSSDKLTLAEVDDLFEVEGMHDAIQSHTSHTSIADTKLAGMWKRAAKLMDEIEVYVEQDEVEPPPTTETVELGRERLLLDGLPKLITDAPLDKYDIHELVTEHGGRIRGITGAGFGGDMFEISFQGTFDRVWFAKLMESLTNLAAWHIYQSVVCADGTRFEFPTRPNPEDD